LLLSLYVTEEAGRKYVRDMPWPPAAECNMITNTQTNADAPAPLLTAFGELMESLDIVARISQSPQGTSQPESSHIMLGSVKPQSKSSIPSGEAAVELNLSTMLKAKLVEPVSFYPGT